MGVKTCKLKYFTHDCYADLLAFNLHV